MLIFVVAAIVVVVVIAWVAVGRETLLLSSRPGTSMYDLYEAVDHIAEGLPDRLAAKLSAGDIEQILRWRLNHLRAKGLATGGRVDEDAEAAAAGARLRGRDIVAHDDEVIDAVLAEALESDLDIDEVDVVVVLDLERGYLEAIGAVGPSLGGDPGEKSPN